MSRQQKTGIRLIEAIEGGWIAWLHPGGADLDSVLLTLARTVVHDDDERWVAISSLRAQGPDPRMPDEPRTHDPANLAEWKAYWSHQPPYVRNVDEDHPTDLPGPAEADVRYYRRMPWCHCGGDHAWHYEPSGPGPGASLAVVVSSY